MLRFFALFYNFDCGQAILVGFARGLGFFSVTNKSIILGFWIIGMPLEYVFAFVFDLGLLGLWLGLMIGLACHIGVMNYVIGWTDW